MFSLYQWVSGPTLLLCRSLYFIFLGMVASSDREGEGVNIHTEEIEDKLKTKNYSTYGHKSETFGTFFKDFQ